MSLAGARDPWQREFNETRQLGDDCFLLLQERASQLQLNAAASVARLSAASRRKLNALNSKIDRLEATVAEETTERESDRRRDMVARLRTHSVQLAELLRPSTSAAQQPALESRGVETLETAERDELGLLVLQRQVMQEQDKQLDDLERVVTSTRHIAVAVNEELDLHSRLLDDMEDDVEDTHGRMTMATRKIKLLLKRQRVCKLMVCLVLTILALIAILSLTLKLAPLG